MFFMRKEEFVLHYSSNRYSKVRLGLKYFNK